MKLQHDYHYMSIKVEQLEILMELKDLSNQLDNTTVGLRLYCAMGRFNYALYQSFQGQYETDCSLYETFSKSAEQVEDMVRESLILHPFSYVETALLLSNNQKIQIAKKKG